jgi:phage gp36-like protein
MEIRNNEKKDLPYLNQFTEILMELCCDIATIYNFRRELIEEQLKVTPDL